MLNFSFYIKKYIQVAIEVKKKMNVNISVMCGSMCKMVWNSINRTNKTWKPCNPADKTNQSTIKQGRNKT